MEKKPLPAMSGQVSQSRYGYLTTSIVPSPELKVACAGKEYCDPDFQVARNDFPCFGLEFVSSGAGSLALDGRQYPLHAGVLFCYGPGTSHRIVNHAAHRMTKYFVDFSGEEAARLLRESPCRPGCAIQLFEVETIRALFDQLVTEGSRNSRTCAAVCAAYVRLIILRTSEGTKPVPPGCFSLLSRFRRWREFIDANYLRLHDLDDIAAELSIRPAYLCRVFKHFGQPSPFKYLTQLKMNRAADLLTGACLPVKAAALEVGYADPYHFSRVFKKHFDCAPARFLEEHWRMRGSTYLTDPAR